MIPRSLPCCHLNIDATQNYAVDGYVQMVSIAVIKPVSSHISYVRGVQG